MSSQLAYVSSELTVNFPERRRSIILTISEAVAQRCSVKQVFSEISQNSQESTCASLFLNEIAGLY